MVRYNVQLNNLLFFVLDEADQFLFMIWLIVDLLKIQTIWLCRSLIVFLLETTRIMNIVCRCFHVFWFIIGLHVLCYSSLTWNYEGKWNSLSESYLGGSQRKRLCSWSSWIGLWLIMNRFNRVYSMLMLHPKNKAFAMMFLSMASILMVCIFLQFYMNLLLQRRRFLL